MTNRSLVVALSLFLALITACTNSPGLPPAPDPRPTEVSSIPPTTIPQVPAPSPETVRHIGKLSLPLTLHRPRAAHTATRLADGRVLITGGFRSAGTAEIPIRSAEIFDPQTMNFTPVSDMIEARAGHTATLLPDGRVLIAGGWGEDGRLSTVELFDPPRNQFSAAASMSAPRAGMTATLLPDGRVLFAGGDLARNQPQLIAEIYDPQTNRFVPSGELNHGRFSHTATLLPDGLVLIAGGRSDNEGTVLTEAEIYDPASEKFVLAGRASRVRHKHAAILLQDGRVLIAGGSDAHDWEGQYRSAEIYDPQTGTFTPTADLHNARFKLRDAALLLNDGTVLIGGGHRQLELFNPQSAEFTEVGQVADDYYFATLTHLQDNRVLIVGGYNGDIQPNSSAWIYDYN
ncbi:MAG: kelch repeat-containing protein [Candidatus Promineifilaceae bacterium]|nr:kelch repeat-containing protein [Candidatus Promineifilaceae bacterium]